MWVACLVLLLMHFVLTEFASFCKFTFDLADDVFWGIDSHLWKGLIIKYAFEVRMEMVVTQTVLPTSDFE